MDLIKVTIFNSVQFYCQKFKIIKKTKGEKCPRRKNTTD